MSEALPTASATAPGPSDDPRVGFFRMAFRIDPIDVLFFGETFATTSWRDVDSGKPSCQTFHGAIFSYLLRSFDCDLEKLGQVMRESGSLHTAIEAAGGHSALASLRTCGPWFAEYAAKGGLQPLVDCPADRIPYPDEQGVLQTARLKPVKADSSIGSGLPGGLHLLGSDPQSDDPLPASGSYFLRATALESYLNDQDLPEHALLSAEDVVQIERRHLIRRSVDRYIVEPGGYFQKGFLRLLPGYGLYGEMLVPEDLRSALSELPNCFPLRLGGENRFCRLEQVEPFDWPGSDMTGIHPGRARLRTLAITPCYFGSAMLFPSSESLTCIAVCSAGNTTISGWDYARRRPKPARDFLLPGSVLFWKIEPNASQKLFGARSEVDGRLGFNHLLQGTWSWL